MNASSGEAVRDRARIVVLSSPLVPQGIEVMRTWYRTQAFPRHSHAYLTLGVMLQGVGTLWLRGETRVLHRGDVVVIAPGDVHTGGLGDGKGLLSYAALHVPTEVLAAASEAAGRAAAADAFASRVTRDPSIAGALRRVSAGLEQSDDVTFATEAAVSAIALLSRQSRNGSHEQRPSAPEPGFVRRARETIDECFARNAEVTLEALAVAGGISPFHLTREFTRAAGLSPHRYVIQARVRRAAELLAAGQRPSDVAATVGFVDQSHLTAHFRRQVGTTPAAYQRAHASTANVRKADVRG